MSRPTWRSSCALSAVLILALACGEGAPEAAIDAHSATADLGVTGDVTQAETAASPDVAGPPDANAAEPDSVSDVAETADVGPDVASPGCVGSCDDGNACTTDGCDGGTCTHVLDPACCTPADPCDDGIACTIDSCSPIQHRCRHDRSSSTCCVTSSDCDDVDACTTDSCVANLCLHTRAGGTDCTCLASIQCDDGDPCTKDVCAAGSCTYTAAPSEGCCTVAADCDDAVAATSDGCQVGLCWHSLAIACVTDADCVATNTCIAAVCDLGACRYGAKSGCCVSDVECADGWSETHDRCVAGDCRNEWGPSQPCDTTADCSRPNDCTATACIATEDVPATCTIVPLSGPSDCCLTAADCPASTTCSAWSCPLGQCVQTPTGGEDVLWSANFDDGSLEGFSANGSSSTVFWQVASVDAMSAPNALYYGRLPQNDYDAGATSGAATSPAMTLPAAPAVLHFDRKLAVEPGQVNDKVWITVDEVGSASVTVWDKTYSQGPGVGWKHVDLSLAAFAGKTVSLTIHFDSVDEKSNGGSYTGAYFDNLVVATPCP